MKRFAVLLVVCAAVVAASRSDYLSVSQKFQGIEHSRYRPGARVPITSRELNAYVETELPKVAGQGMRNATVELQGNNVAVARAVVNFVKLQSDQGEEPSWILKQFMNGDHNLVVTAQISSNAGYATVNLTRLELDGIAVQGAALDFLIRNYLIPKYPDAKVGRPFQLDYGMDRLEVTPGVAYVVMAKK